MGVVTVVRVRCAMGLAVAPQGDAHVGVFGARLIVVPLQPGLGAVSNFVAKPDLRGRHFFAIASV